MSKYGVYRQEREQREVSGKRSLLTEALNGPKGGTIIEMHYTGVLSVHHEPNKNLQRLTKGPKEKGKRG